MSLLLEALKKAELAKQAAKEVPPPGEPAFTRDQLPDISQPMDIRSEDLSLVESKPKPAPKPVEKTVLELAPEEPPRAAPIPQPPPAARAAPMEMDFSPPGDAAERRQAQQLFEAKEMDVNPRRPFYITLGALGLFALGTVGYFWYQLQPRSTFRAPPPAATSAAPPPAAAPAAPAVVAAVPAAPPAASTVTPPAGTQAAVAAPGATAAPGTAPAAAPQARPGPLLRQTVPATGAAGEAQQPAPARSEGDIRITRASIQTDPVLESAFQAFNAGDLVKARSDYQQALQSRPDNRDALLGLAAVEIGSKRHEAAEAYYTRLLELDPRDALAQAGLIGLRGQLDPLAGESRLKLMIAAQPEASFLQFTLGNQYAAQGRWTEAQQAYFKAYSGDPDHPDIAYNLAVSLDRMHQTKPALEYYRRALTLAQGRAVSFDRARVEKRISQLER
jgi:tetratricopeptide (TPR) repeat protein